MDLRTDDFDYPLPPERIAQTPVEPRDASRLLVIHRETGSLEHRHFRDLTDYLRPGDVLVANDSRVLPGRLWARKPTGGRVELLLLRELEDGWWEALARPAHRLRPGQRLELVSAPDGDRPAGSRAAMATASPLAGSAPAAGSADGAGPMPAALPGEQLPPARQYCEVGERTPAGGVRVRFSEPVGQVLAQYGRVPLPPYIHAPLADPERYQTVYARVAGSAAAPTAGLHFTPRLLEAIAAMGVRFAFVTLHVGPDTFRPVRAERILNHEMHAEFVAIPDETARAIAAAKGEGRRVIAVGTTAVRALEAWAGEGARGRGQGSRPEAPGGRQPFSALALDPTPLIQGWSGWTRLFIYPGYQFQVVDALITNFHLPRSTLLMLVSALAGRDLMLRAYAEAIAREYRFYSFGDCCLIL